jgi:hypothetical protein
MFGACVAMAAAGIVVANGAFAADEKKAAAPKAEKKTVKCMGNNECKGKGACGGDGHACAGKNECKGKGWTMTSTDADCTKGGGKVVKEEKKAAAEEKKS